MIDYLATSDGALFSAGDAGIISIGEIPAPTVKTFFPTFPLTMGIDGELAYVACRSLKAVTIYNTRTFVQTGTLNVVSPPDGVFIHGGLLWVTFTGAPTPAYTGIKRYDLSTLQLVDEIFTGVPNWAFAKTSTKLFVSTPTANTIKVYNLADLTLQSTFAVPELQPYGLAVDEANNRFWYSCGGTNVSLYERKISDFSLNRSLGGLSKEMYQIIHYPEKNLLLTGGANLGKIYSIRLDTFAINKTITGTAQGGLAYPSGIAFDKPRRRLWMCGNNTVKTLDIRLLE